jgi:fructan beta-fructosidase
VIWHDASHQWVMVFAAADHVKFYGSPDLKKWHPLSEFGREIGAHGGVWECPDLFPINIDQTDVQKWVLTQSMNPGSPNGGSGTQYFIGNFDGVHFTLDSDFAKACPKGQGVWIDYGRDNYAGVTFSDIPKSDNRRISIGWMSNWDYAQEVPTAAWRSAMTLPRQFILKKTPAGLRLCSKPVRETEQLRDKGHSFKNSKIEHTLNLSEKIDFPATVSELTFDVELPEKALPKVGVRLSNTKGEAYRIGFDAGSKQFFSDRTHAGDNRFSSKFASNLHIAPRTAAGSTVKMHLFFDRASCELFADEGMTVMTEIFFPTEDFKTLEIFTEGGAVRVKHLKIWALDEAKGKE